MFPLYYSGYVYAFPLVNLYCLGFIFEPTCYLLQVRCKTTETLTLTKIQTNIKNQQIIKLNDHNHFKGSGLPLVSLDKLVFKSELLHPVDFFHCDASLEAKKIAMSFQTS